VAVRIDDATCLKATDAAILVEVDGTEYWIPQSQVTEDSEIWKEGDTGTLVITDFIAEQKGLA
jgi:hypothetical protein